MTHLPCGDVSSRRACARRSQRHVHPRPKDRLESGSKATCLNNFMLILLAAIVAEDNAQRCPSFSIARSFISTASSPNAPVTPARRPRAVFQRLMRAPQPLDEHVIHPAPASVHRDPDAGGGQRAGKGGAGGLAPLVGIVTRPEAGEMIRRLLALYQHPRPTFAHRRRGASLSIASAS